MEVTCVSGCHTLQPHYIVSELQQVLYALGWDCVGLAREQLKVLLMEHTYIYEKINGCTSVLLELQTGGGLGTASVNPVLTSSTNKGKRVSYRSRVVPT